MQFPYICRVGRLCTLIVLLTTVQTVGAAERTTIDVARFAGFLGKEQRIENFRRTDLTFPQAVIRSPQNKSPFAEQQRDLNEDYKWRGKQQDLAAFLDRSVTTSLLVVHDDALVSENYFRGYDNDSLCTSMSVAKSFISGLIGTTVADGSIKSIDDPVTDYVAALKGSGYDGVPIKHVLQMSSGIDFSEEYDDLESDINLVMAHLAGGGSIVDYVRNLKSKGPSGKTYYYASVDTQVLAMLLEQVTGKSVATLIEERIWQPLGMESDATWCLDNHGDEIAFAFLNAAPRDYAKFGRLFLNRGHSNGHRILPQSWVKDSITPDKDYLRLKDLYVPGWDIGYQYQWWVPAGDSGEFTGIGVWGQYLYVNPRHRTIIVKTSVDPEFHTRDMETIAVFRSIVSHYSGQ